MSKKYDLIIVGGGAGGLSGGVFAVKAGLKVLIVERLNKAGRKIVATGGGRCNLTRDIPVGELLEGYFGKKTFVRSAIYSLLPQQIMTFFESLGLKCVIEDGGGVYPDSYKAQDVLKVLESEYLRLGGEFEFDTQVDEILQEGYIVCGVASKGRKFFGGSVLIAGGGCSMKELGSDGSAFKLAKDVGHKVLQPLAGLVGLVVPCLNGADVPGLSLKATVQVGLGKRSEKLFGDILFTHKGLSGPVILDLSRFISQAINDNGGCEIFVSWGGYNREFWEVVIARARIGAGKKSFYNLLCEYFPKRFVSYIFSVAGGTGDIQLSELKNSYKDKVFGILVDSKFEVSRTEGFAKSMVTCGGVFTKEINPKTMQSKLAENLYFAGEVIDVDGRCGGYNLQWAFSSAHLAVKNVCAMTNRMH